MAFVTEQSCAISLLLSGPFLDIFYFFYLELLTTTKNDGSSSDFPLTETIAGIAVGLAICLVIFVVLMVRRKR